MALTDEAMQTGDDSIDDAIELVEVRLKLRQAKQINEELVRACESALQLRGIHAAILEPFALSGDKETLRRRYKDIEAQIRAAIQEANKLKGK